MPGLGASFGRGAATGYQQDLANSDCILFMGSNMAEAHPVGFRWPLKAKEKGATLIHVDPRFSRTSALCDLFVGIRAGTDIAFLGGVIRYVIENERWFKEYVLAYTNAATIINDDFRDPEDLDGLFSGFNPESKSYNAAEGHWTYKGQSPGTGNKKDQEGQHGMHGPSAQGNVDATSEPDRDPTLEHPRCVFQLIRKHFARYTPDVVAQICGCPAEDVVRVAELLCANSGRERTSAIVYAVGWTQHTTGVQIIRCAGILQLLLGNIGRPGGAIQAMRGHSSIQGLTDVPTLYDLLPGYLPQPKADPDHETLAQYVEREGLKRGYWSNFRKFIVSLLKAWYGEAAQADNDYRYEWLARLDGDYSALPTFDRMSKGQMKGYIVMGMNPAGGGINAGLQRKGCEASIGWSSSTGSKRKPPYSGRTIPTHRPLRRSRPRYFSFPPPRRPRRTGRSPIPTDYSSGTTRRSTRHVTAGPMPGSSTTSANGSRRSMPARPTPRISLSCT